MTDYEQTYTDIIEGMRERIARVRDEIDSAMVSAGRKGESITLIGVSKFFPPEYARAAFTLGIADLGENRVQELLDKEQLLASEGLHPAWHLIGTLQTRKVRQIIGKTALIHSVDSMELLEEIERRSLSAGIITEILLQVNVSGELTKHGFSAESVREAVESANRSSSIRLRGLMTMAPVQQQEHDARPVFEETRHLFHDLSHNVENPLDWNCLSMGMSQDYVDAIHAGSTHIRIGTAIFGPRC